MTPDDLVLSSSGLRFQGRIYPCSIGRSGLSNHKTEGDGATPKGVHAIIGMLYRPDRLARPARWAHPILLGDLWSDDPKDKDYNMMVRAPYEKSHECLHRSDPLYDLILLTGWNWPYAVKNRGSAVFLHQWRRPGMPTEGCIGLRRRDLQHIAGAIKVRTRLIIQQGYV
jgi:L,D-peptidoglycan transpeptidase YkuD (ErfK/YbiS/YcfS/YnhG family)